MSKFDTYFLMKAEDAIEYAQVKVPQKDWDIATMTCKEIGDGNLNWPAIVEACRYAGVKWYIVERDSGLLDPFDSLQRSIINMRETMGL